MFSCSCSSTTVKRWLLVSFLALPAVGVLTSRACAAPSGHAERLSYDPQSGQWVQIASPTPGTEDGDLELARSLLARGKAKKARSQLKKWLKRYPDSPRYPEALFYLADAEFQLARYYKAYERYEELLDSVLAGDLIERALRRELAIAELFLTGKRRKVLGVALLPATEEGLDMLDSIAMRRITPPELAEQALKLRADYFYGQGQFAEAELEYARLAREFPRGAYTPMATLRSAQAAMASFGGIKFDDAPLIEAETRFRLVLRRYPKFAEQQQVPQLLEQIRNTRAQKEYHIASWYHKTKRYQAAKFYYQTVIEHWSDTHWASLAQGGLEALPAEPSAPAEGAGTLPSPVSLPLGLPIGAQ